MILVTVKYCVTIIGTWENNHSKNEPPLMSLHVCIGRRQSEGGEHVDYTIRKVNKRIICVGYFGGNPRKCLKNPMALSPALGNAELMALRRVPPGTSTSCLTRIYWSDNSCRNHM